MGILPTCAPKIALKIEALGNFSSNHAQSPNIDLPLYLASRGVQGKISLKYNKFALPIEFRDVVKVTLNGISSIRKPWEGLGMVQRYIQLQSSFLDLVNVSRILDGQSSSDGIHVEFSFVLPKVVCWIDPIETQPILKRQDLPKLSSLPSSLAAESVSTTDLSGSTQSVHAKIVYTLRAQVFRHSVSLGYTEVPIRIYNDMSAQPPICLAHFPFEYRNLHQKPLERRFRKTDTFIAATITEPSPFVFSSEEDSALTALPVSLAYSPPSVRKCDGAPQSTELINVTFIWQIKSLTFLSTQPLVSMPTTVLPGSQSPVNMITGLGRKHELKCQLTPRCNRPASLMEPSSDSWTESFRLPLLIDRAVLLAPTVFTPYISRRYNLVLWIKLEGFSSDKTTLQLEVPVQIAYQREERNPVGVELPPGYGSWDELELEDDNVGMEAPIYSP